ncbi:MAG: BON domain-containing protein [Candidatus Competibacteraceae bacterium]|nr:BON domain-containing protein [Candidatus Competibacteraceae bacterium]MBK7982738.1 BON domain-containing protein [Candidatus Competibacteraceae bacterium]MBK8898715.1 BON domain-containing protein [Candidatus Competibacteraceae bacterium]MBK8962515.1 BON domain-containing protein [Candidatus Competibacteraceae bacterium]MBK9951729.1 BON domain-containing protein [Candidatus Competibacteraceae bacterium]
MKAWPLRLIVAGLATVLLSGCVGLLLGGTAVGVGVAHDRRTTGTVMDDQTVELKIYDALNKKLPPGNRISATSYNGVVLLTGEAVSEGVKQQADAVVRSITPPVREVYNELVIARPIPLSARSNDSFLTSKVKTALFKIKIDDFDPSRVKVVTDRGVVYLMGLVRPNEGDAAANVASQVSGVRQVVTLFEFIN